MGRPDRRSLVCDAAHSFDVARQGYVSLLDGRTRRLRSDARRRWSPRVAAYTRRRRLRRSLTRWRGRCGHRPTSPQNIGRRTSGRRTSGGRRHRFGAPDTIWPVFSTRGPVQGYRHRSVEVLCQGDDPVPRPVHCGGGGRMVGPADPVRAGRRRPVGVLPRNVAEFARILRPGGVVVTVTPEPGHLAELAGPMGCYGSPTTRMPGWSPIWRTVSARRPHSR